MDLSQVELYNEEVVKQRAQRDKDYAEYDAAGRIWGLVPRERITKITFPRVKKEIIDGYLSMDDMSTTVSDVLDSYGIDGAIPTSYLKPVIPGSKIVGPAVTIRNIPVRKTPTQGAIDHDFIAMSTRDIYYIGEPGDVLVSDFGGNLEVSNMGGQSCTVGKSCGFAGNIVNGCCRDVSSIREMGYPVFCTGTTQITGKFRMECVEMNGPITLCGKLVEPGDLMVADDSGVCIVPYDLAEDVLEKCLSIAASEERMRQLIESKAPISELRPLFRSRYK
ncbi:MAG: RraA family protein [Lachnospiraceae bacterium]|nr:RraA family protein [Lachnospiraceae bacterium]